MNQFITGSLWTQLESNWSKSFDGTFRSFQWSLPSRISVWPNHWFQRISIVHLNGRQSNESFESNRSKWTMDVLSDSITHHSSLNLENWLECRTITIYINHFLELCNDREGRSISLGFARFFNFFLQHLPLLDRGIRDLIALRCVIVLQRNINTYTIEFLCS